jgi:dolichyl-phosphate-mannose-protein mannosyltransferase
LATDNRWILFLLTKLPTKLVLLILALSAALITYSQLVAYFGDESLHLLAARLISKGQRPYADFFYHHPPIFAYLLAILFGLFGPSWRVAHLLSALFVSATLWLIAAYVYSRSQQGASATRAAMLATILLAANVYVLLFATVALPNGLCLFFMVAAFLLAVGSAEQSRATGPLLAGACAGLAVSSYFLTAPVLLVLLLWFITRNRYRAQHTLLFCLGIFVSFIPLLWFVMRWPNQVWTDLIQYHLFYRAGNDLNLWFNLREIAYWFFSVQGSLLVIMTVACLGRGPIDVSIKTKSELRLSAWIAFALALLISIARPVSAFYFVLLTPFLVLPASFGLMHLYRADKKWRAILAVLTVAYLLGLLSERSIWRREGSFVDYRVVKSIANVVDEVTPPTGMIYAFEAVYFAADKVPPPGLENRFNPRSQADDWLKARRFDTVCIAATNPRVKEFGLLDQYQQKRTFQINGFDFYVLSNRPSTQDRGR